MWITELLGLQQPPREVTLRCDRSTFAALRQHWRQNRDQAQLAFGLAEVSTTAMGVLLRLWDLFLLSPPEDLAIQTPVSVVPTRAAQSLVYLAALQTNLSMVSFQGRTVVGLVSVSEADRQHMRQSAAYLHRRCAQPVSLASIVFDRDFSLFDGQLYQSDHGTFRTIDRLEILGRPSVFLSRQSHNSSTGEGRPDYDRRVRSPAWEKYPLETPRVSLVGLQGKGAHVLPLLIEMGVGTKGWIAGSDCTAMHPSNVARIPYPAQPRQHKVDAAAAYARSLNRSAHFMPLRGWVEHAPAADWFKASTLAIIASDNPDLRATANDWAIQYGIPLIDLGSDAPSDNGTLATSGQVRVVVPGETGCRECQNHPEPADSPLDQLRPDDIKELLVHGYLRGLSSPPSPALAGLNALTAAYAMQAVLAIVLGPGFGSWDLLRFDLDQGVTVAARTSPRESCPVCGLAAIRHPWRINAPNSVPNGLNWATLATDANPPGPVHGDSTPNSVQGASHA